MWFDPVFKYTQNSGTRTVVHNQLRSKNVAIAANVAEAQPLHSQSGTLTVVCYTPAGNAIAVQAKNAEHAAFLRKMNPSQ